MVPKSDDEGPRLRPLPGYHWPVPLVAFPFWDTQPMGQPRAVFFWSLPENRVTIAHLPLEQPGGPLECRDAELNRHSASVAFLSAPFYRKVA